MLGRPFSGVIAAPFLPMHEGGKIDWPGLERCMAWLAGQRPGAIAMNMDASEVISLTEEEQDAVIERCRAVIGRRMASKSGVVAGSTAAAARKGRRFARLMPKQGLL